MSNAQHQLQESPPPHREVDRLDHEIPPGWVGNPSAWSQRLPLVAIATVGCGIATYMGLYQVNVIDTVWDPFFGQQTLRILDSRVSHVLPIPDALLGAIGYLLDAVTGVIGGTGRWKTMPWIVVLFGFAVGPLGAISILLVMLQPVMFEAWCFLCLTSAVISIVMIGPAMDEVLASLQFLKREKWRGRSVWRAFWGLKQ